jgi:pyruvate kinase
LNFSHGTHEVHFSAIKNIRSLSQHLNKPVAIMQDLQGPKLRVGKMKQGSVYLQTGSKVRISIKEVLGDEHVISTSYQALTRDVKPGDMILLDDGQVRLKAQKIEQDSVLCLVEEGARLSDHKGINLPGVKISQPSFTEKDQHDLDFGIKMGVDWVAISFVRNAAEVLQLKELLNSQKKEIRVIAKIEKPEAIADLENIIEAADGVMIARGDLGVEMPLEQVPVFQKKIIRLCIEKGKPVITATQMLESMRHCSRPTRAEVSDVANAIFDGSDAVMLSAETATGDFPIETVNMMNKIICESERTMINFDNQNALRKIHRLTVADAASFSACETAKHLQAKAIVAFTNSGFTARMVSKYRPRTDIIAFTPHKIVQNQLNLSWGILPLLMDDLNDTDQIINHTEKVLLTHNFVQKGEVIIILLGTPIFVKGTTNLMKVHVVGE